MLQDEWWCACAFLPIIHVHHVQYILTSPLYTRPFLQLLALTVCQSEFGLLKMCQRLNTQATSPFLIYAGRGLSLHNQKACVAYLYTCLNTGLLNLLHEIEASNKSLPIHPAQDALQVLSYLSWFLSGWCDPGPEPA